jgi:hypothetical protein
MKCVGTLGFIKASVGGGLEIRLRSHADTRIDAARDALLMKLLAADSSRALAATLEVAEAGPGRTTLRLPASPQSAAYVGLSADLFEILLAQQQLAAAAREPLEFTVSHATIEQVFLAMAEADASSGAGGGAAASGGTNAPSASRARSALEMSSIQAPPPQADAASLAGAAMLPALYNHARISPAASNGGAGGSVGSGASGGARSGAPSPASPGMGGGSAGGLSFAHAAAPVANTGRASLLDEFDASARAAPTIDQPPVGARVGTDIFRDL